MLSVAGLQSSYGPSQVLFDVQLSVGEGEVVTLLGRNGMGKTTTVRSIMGLLKPRSGTISFTGREVSGATPESVARLGVGLVPEGRQVFPTLTVRENLVATASNRLKRKNPWTLDRVYALFPRLGERASQAAGTLSGGEQQMLAIGRALMSRPRLLLLDEPSLGLAPLIVRQIFEVLGELNRNEGLTVFLVEQNAYHALKLAHRGYVMVNGVITMSGTGRELLSRSEVRAAYLEGGESGRRIA